MAGPLIIDDSTPNDLLFRPEFGRGAEPRDNFPPVTASPPAQMKLIPKSEWSDRIKEKKRLGSTNSAVRRRAGMKHAIQWSMPYCWAHSTTNAVMVRRALDGQEFVPLSAYSVACKLMNFKAKGGWCGYSLEFIKEHGIVPASMWPNNPEQGMSRSLDNPTNWGAAKQYLVTNDWVDLDAQHYYYQTLRFEQVATCLLNNEPCALDFNWWGHSVCGLDLEEPEPGDFGIRILNSWPEWGDDGEAVLRGSKAIPNSAVAVRAVTAA